MQAAIDAVRPHSGPATIVISAGNYTGQVYVPPDKPDLTLLGVPGHPADVVLTDDIAHGTVTPNGNQYGTDCSATVSVAGNGFSAYGITFQNSFDPEASPQITSPQAV
ncbi:MAG TPA: pectin esterase, partial [Streptosporangiaceae bacterium]|nr:pectin esterase [Streptosporangiaceae bacterium]